MSAERTTFTCAEIMALLAQMAAPLPPAERWALYEMAREMAVARVARLEREGRICAD